MTPGEQAQAFDDGAKREAARVLKVASPVLFSYFAFLVVAHATVLPVPARQIMMTSAGATAVAVAVIAVSAHRDAPWILSRTHHWLTVCGVLAAFNGCLHLALIPEPVQTTNLMLAVMAAALFLRSRLGMTVIIAMTGLTLLGAATRFPSPDWMHFSFALASTDILGVTLFIVGARNRRSLIQASLDEQVARKTSEVAVTQTQLSELRYRTVVDRCPDAVFVVRNGVIRYVNPAAEVLLDIRQGSVIGTPVSDLRPAVTQPVLGDDAERLELLDSSGQVITVAISTTEVQFDHASVHLVFARDMSERLASEKLQSDFLAAVSHELRTPLTSVVGAIGLLERGGHDERERTLLDVASRNAHRLGELIEDLLDLRTLETRDETDIRLLTLQSVVKTAVASFADPGGRIHVHSDDEVWVRGDLRALARVVHHLVDNAVKFGGVDQDIDIRIGTVADDACIHVSDRGPGVPRRYRETLFHGFSQGKAGLARPHGGFGVGLTLSRGIVRQHKGRMTLHDRDGGGATVTICLPRIEPPAG